MRAPAPEEVMDIYSLVATNTRSGGYPARMDAKSEDRYYSDQVARPRLSPGLLGSIVVTSCVLLIFVGLILT